MTSRMSSSSRKCQWISVDILSTLPSLKEFIRQTPVPTWFICLRKKFTWIRTGKTERDRKREAKRWGEKEVISSEVKEKMRLQWETVGAELRDWRQHQTPQSKHMYIYTYYIHTYTTHTYIHIHIHTYTTHTHTYTHIYTYKYYTHTHTHTYVYIHTYIHTHTNIHIYIHTHTYIHNYIHAYTRT